MCQKKDQVCDMQYFSENQFNTIRQMPGVCLIKDLGHRFQCLTEDTAQLLGYKNAEAARGSLDIEMKCDAAKGVGRFRELDLLASERGKSACIHTYTWGNGQKKVFYSQKKRLLDTRNQCIGVMTQTIDLMASHSIFEQFITNLQADKQHLAHSSCTYDAAIGYTYQLAASYPHLTVRESECLFYLMRGKSCKDIAVILGRSDRTIEKHVANMMTKLSCSSRRQLIEYAEENQLMGFLLNNILKKINTTVFL